LGAPFFAALVDAGEPSLHVIGEFAALLLCRFVPDANDQGLVESGQHGVGDRLQVVEHGLVVGLGSRRQIGECRMRPIGGDQHSQGAGLGFSRCGQRSNAGALGEIRRATDGHVKAIRKAQHDLGIAMLPPNEEDVRQILGLMFGAYHTQPTATSELLIDMLVMELTADDLDRPFCSPAIMAAAREMWSTLSTPPSIADVLKATKTHQRRIEAAFKELGDTLEALQWADDIVEPDKPVDESDEDYIPIEA
jgi:hypothetical protein